MDLTEMDLTENVNPHGRGQLLPTQPAANVGQAGDTHRNSSRDVTCMMHLLLQSVPQY